MRVVILLTALLFLFTCTQDQGDTLLSSGDQDEREYGLPRGSTIEMNDVILNALMKSAQDGVTTYTFDDLEENCTPESVIPNPYQDLNFLDTPYLSVCTYPEVVAYRSILFSQDNEDPITLPIELTQALADSVAIMSLNYYHSSVPSLIIYDEDFNELGRVSGSPPTFPMLTWEVLEISAPAGTLIKYIALENVSNANFWDNLAIRYLELTPTIELALDKTMLWPPNHKMQLVAQNISAKDFSCDYDLGVTVTSNEDINGQGDGNTNADWLVEENPDGSYNVWLRAERAGKDAGRIYTITASAIDCDGFIITESADVSVPKSMKGGKKKK